MPASASKFDCVFFDFDGVIVDSVEAKITAFGELYDEFGPEIRAEVEAYQRAVPGETRFAKIPRFHRDLLGIRLSEQDVMEWSNRLSAIVLDQVVASPLMDDVSEVLAGLIRQGTAAHVVSGTPHGELQVIVDRKGLRPFFLSVRGSPEEKPSIVRDIMARDQLDPARCLFVGDAMTDYDAAQECGNSFLGRAAPDCDPFPGGTMVVERLGEFFIGSRTSAGGSSADRRNAA